MILREMYNFFDPEINKIDHVQSLISHTKDQDTTTKLTQFIVQTVHSRKQQKYLEKFTVNIAIPASSYTPSGPTVAHRMLNCC